MAAFPEAMNRIIKDQWICMNCGTKQKGSKDKQPLKCRKCGRVNEFRIKHKLKKK